MARRAFGLAAAFLSGTTLLLLVTLALSHGIEVEVGSNSEPELLMEESISQLNPDVAVADLVELRKEHGSALTGSCLETIDSPDAFVGAVAQVAGFQPLPVVAEAEPATAPPNVVVALRTSAFQYEQLAHQLEMQRGYEQADQLRELAAHVRGLSRQMAGDNVQPLLSRQACEVETR